MQIPMVLRAKAAMMIGRSPSIRMFTGANVKDFSEEEDETAELLRELEKIKRERAEQRAQEASRSSA